MHGVMSTFAIFDLHGYPVDKFKALLDKASFSDSDTLYILGDVIDRSGDGWTIMKYLRGLMRRFCRIFSCIMVSDKI